MGRNKKNIGKKKAKKKVRRRRYTPQPPPVTDAPFPAVAESVLAPDEGTIVVRRSDKTGRVELFLSDKPPYREIRQIGQVVRHSPDGMEYGYGGSGPADLALTILTVVVGPLLAEGYYEQFNQEIVAEQDREERVWGLKCAEIREWMHKRSQHIWEVREGGSGVERCTRCGVVKHSRQNTVCPGHRVT